MNKGYPKQLAEEWIDWVETNTPPGTREQEIFPFIKNRLSDHSPKTLVDVGCGQGDCSFLIPINTHYIGIDPSFHLINRAKQLNNSLNKQFLEGAADNIPLEPNSADAAMSIWVWSHLEDIVSAAKEMFRVLKSKGHFLIITASPDTYEERKTFYKTYSIQNNLLTGTFDLGEGKILTNTTLYLHTKKQLLAAITGAGLTITSVSKLGKAESSDLGLYIVIEGEK